MKLSNLLIAGTLILGMSACSNDEPATPGNGGQTPVENGFYSKIKLKHPRSARSNGNEGEEVGQGYENKIGSILVVLATKNDAGNYSYLTHALNDAPAINNDTYTIIFSDKDKLFQQAGNTVYVFAYCNPSTDLADKFRNGQVTADTDFVNLACESNVEESWTTNGFMMSSVDITSKELDTADNLKTYNSSDNAFDLGTVSVIRTSSRFDFRDASEAKDLTYVITDEDAADKPETARITLVNVAMFNQRGEFYYLPRNKAAGAEASVLCPGSTGMEEGYIVTPTARNYTSPLPVDPAKPLGHGNETYNSLKWTSLSGLLDGTEDIDDGWGNKVEPATDKEGYHIWRYTTENTFEEGVSLDREEATGFVFEATVDPTVSEELQSTTGFRRGEDEMYIYNNKLYLNPLHMYKVIKEAPVSNLSNAFNKVFDVAVTTVDEKEEITITKKTDADLEKAGFVVYTPDAKDKQYYCYYFAYNRHNDDGKPYEEGMMEYGTVRNNVYKLAVTSIKKFGTFLPSENVEEWDVFFKLSIKVLPWVVRINNIDF